VRQECFLGARERNTAKIAPLDLASPIQSRRRARCACPDDIRTKTGSRPARIAMQGSSEEMRTLRRVVRTVRQACFKWNEEKNYVESALRVFSRATNKQCAVRGVVLAKRRKKKKRQRGAFRATEVNTRMMQKFFASIAELDITLKVQMPVAAQSVMPEGTKTKKEKFNVKVVTSADQADTRTNSKRFA